MERNQYFFVPHSRRVSVSCELRLFSKTARNNTLIFFNIIPAKATVTDKEIVLMHVYVKIATLLLRELNFKKTGEANFAI